MPLKLLLYERKMLLYKSCMSSPEILRLCGLFRSNYNDLIDMCNKYDIHYNMSVCKIKSGIRTYFINVLHVDGLA